MKTLKDVKVGDTVTVARINGAGALKRRIMDMGVTKGTEFMSARSRLWATRSRSPYAAMS